jgi:hypothetical protein
MKNYKKGFVIPLVIAIVALLGIGGGAYVYVNKKSAEKLENSIREISKNSTATTTNVACTMDAKMCPDGSYVGRSGPKCEFVCPSINTSLKTYRLNDGGKLEVGYVPFEIKYPSDWKYIEFSRNVDGIIFCPQDIADCGVSGGGGQMSGTIFIYPSKNNIQGNINKDSDTLYSFKNQKGEIFSYITLSDIKYKKEFNEMISSFKFTNTKVTETVKNQPAYLISAYTKNEKNYIDVDYTEWLHGDAYIKAAVEDGDCPNINNCQAYPNGYKRNQNPMIRTFEVSQSASIEVSGLINGILNSYKTNVFPISFETFKNTVSTLKPVLPSKPTFKDPLDFITIDVSNDLVTKITEPYQE